ncbi:hypothetical protein FHR24_000532 [Wenyingzhuangia heitensis]|uniref:Cytochrome c domain-containing protein n=1 Tax=Wenyingzhuangia heitensis TaxID=1487859 RepID=A0ABX0U5P6_9FLAO|nr:hypothetical protein [Wenyingzhuangia heitensis]NIJ44093.1 hypothetical protein [Wenyingzhuangia heitensis]
MKKNKINPLFLVVCVLVCLQACKPSKKEVKSNYQNVKISVCDPVSSWFPHLNTKEPLEGVTSVFATPQKATNLVFHQWSWQKFLWLTKPTSVTDKTPLFLENKNEIIQVTDLMMDTINIPVNAKVVLFYDEQACSNGVLQTNSKFKSDTNTKIDTIMYSIYSSKIMLDAAKVFKTKILKDSLFDNDFVFPVGSLELKVSWVATSAIPKSQLGEYYTTQAAYIKADKTYGYKEVAMLGMHVVGVVENHPEFIWATFQHNDLAPLYDWEDDIAEESFNTLLYKGDKPSTLDGITWDSKKNNALKPIAAYELFKYGVPVNNGGGFMETSQEEPSNFNNIKSINICVSEAFKRQNNNDVWANYFYNGSLWIDTDEYATTKEQAKKIVELGDSIASAKPGALARGSVNCANVTMETYTQTFENEISEIAVDNLANCFSCHSATNFSTKANSPLYLSHLFGGYLKASQGLTPDEIEQLKETEHFLKFVKK